MATHPLKAFRLSKKQSQADLAGELGVARLTLLRWEKGIRQIDEKKVPSISEITGIPAKVLRPDLVKRLEKLIGVDQ